MKMRKEGCGMKGERNGPNVIHPHSTLETIWSVDLCLVILTVSEFI